MRRLLLALCALTLLSGCGGGVDPSFLAAAVQNTEEAGGAELAFQVTMRAPGADEPLVMTGTGVEDARAGRSHMNLSIPGAGEMELIADGLTMYMKIDALEDQLGKEWMKVDLLHAWDELGIETDSFGQFGQGASEQLGMLRAVSDGVTEHGSETVVGVEATHYSATIDLRRYVDLAPEEERDGARRSIERMIEISGQSEIPMDVWIDDDQRVRRMEWEQIFRQGAEEVRADMVAEYVRFGVPVDIDVPDDDDVFDATQLGVQELQRRHP